MFVLTRHARDPIEMAGGTTFRFVTDGPEAVLERAVDAAAGLDVRLGGGAAAIQQYLCRGLVDEMHLAVVPELLGSGARLFERLGRLPTRYETVEVKQSTEVTHVWLARRQDSDGVVGDGGTRPLTPPVAG
ncbi:MAG: dihydrofolate reductase family protein [Egicoccus sp.]